jgi:hypothetical protein
MASAAVSLGTPPILNSGSLQGALRRAPLALSRDDTVLFSPVCAPRRDSLAGTVAGTPVSRPAWADGPEPLDSRLRSSLRFIAFLTSPLYMRYMPRPLDIRGVHSGGVVAFLLARAELALTPKE